MPTYYLRRWIILHSPGEQFLKADDEGNAIPIGVTWSQNPFRVENFQTDFPGSEFHVLTLAAGEYYPRMARPSTSIDPDASPGHNPMTDSLRNERTTSTGHLHALIQRLEQIATVVQPIGPNLQAYGHEICDVLILACTEVEAQWKGIMKANGYKTEKMN